MKTNVLIIDDNRRLVEKIKEYFENNNNIKILFTASNGLEGIKTIENHQKEIDVILLDLIMPKKDGLFVLEYLYNNGIDKRVIVLTSYNEQRIIRKVSELGASYFILKPFDLEDLENKIMDIANYNHKAINLLSNNIQRTITKTLHELGIPSHVKGYQYIKEGIFLIYNYPEMTKDITKELYPMIAHKYDSKATSVERDIRHAIEISWNRGDWELMESIFGNSIDLDRAKPTNSEFIITIADSLRLEFAKTIPIEI